MLRGGRQVATTDGRLPRRRVRIGARLRPRRRRPGVLLKAWFDRSRYTHEIAALRAWSGRRVPRVDDADDLAVAALDASVVGPVARPGPPGSARRSRRRWTSCTPRRRWTCFHGSTITWRRWSSPHRGTAADAGRGYPRPCLDAVTHLDLAARHPVLLHTDLYRENVLFDTDRQPVFIDPLPMVGDATYDWAFWVVYYDLVSDPSPRLRLALTIAGFRWRSCCRAASCSASMACCTTARSVMRGCPGWPMSWPNSRYGRRRADLPRAPRPNRLQRRVPDQRPPGHAGRAGRRPGPVPPGPAGVSGTRSRAVS